MKTLISHDAQCLAFVPHFTQVDGCLTTAKPITRTQLLEAAIAAIGGQLSRMDTLPVSNPKPAVGVPPSSLNRPVVCTEPSTPLLVKWLQMYYEPLSIEAALAVFQTRTRVIEVSELARGTAEQVHLLPQMIVERAVALQASQVIVVHNHPGDMPAPSPADIKWTHDAGLRLAAVGVHLEDAWIIGHREWSSLRYLGHLRDYAAEFVRLADDMAS